MSRATALITGASSGIGLELARLFAAEDHDLILVARSEEQLRTLAAELGRNHDVTVHVLVKDLAAAQAPQEIHQQVQSRGLPVDVVVNNAGFGLRGTVADLDLARQLGMIQVNVTALTALTRLFLPGMIARGRGGILNLASTAAFQPGPYMAVYYATKA